MRRRVIARPGHNKVGDRTARAGAWTARAIEGPARPHPLPQCSAKKVTGRHPSCRGGDGATVGEPSGRLCGRTRGELHRTDARTQTEAAPDEQTEMRCRPANQSLITDVLRSVPSSARSIESYRHSRPGRGVDKLHRSWLTWDIRTYGRPPRFGFGSLATSSDGPFRALLMAVYPSFASVARQAEVSSTPLATPLKTAPRRRPTDTGRP